LASVQKSENYRALLLFLLHNSLKIIRKRVFTKYSISSQVGAKSRRVIGSQSVRRA
jgi:hypothetical protein